jgi:hypothetical protein
MTGCRRTEESEYASYSGRQTLTAPALILIEFAIRFNDQIPEDVCLCIREMFVRNMVRNDPPYRTAG